VAAEVAEAQAALVFSISTPVRQDTRHKAAPRRVLAVLAVLAQIRPAAWVPPASQVLQAQTDVVGVVGVVGVAAPSTRLS